MMLIGFSGPAGSGKDTAAMALARHYVSYDTMAFADTLKQGICEMFSLESDVFNSRELKEKKLLGINKSPRELAQIIGTDCIRKMIGPDTWIHIMARRYAAFCATGLQRLAITDVRFENEADWIRSKGGSIIHIIRPVARWNPDGHASEVGIEIRDGDLILTNTGSVEEFEERLYSLVSRLEESHGLTQQS